MIPPAQFLEHVIWSTLRHLAVAEPRLGIEASARLLLGTAIAESGPGIIGRVVGCPRGHLEVAAARDVA